MQRTNASKIQAHVTLPYCVVLQLVHQVGKKFGQLTALFETMYLKLKSVGPNVGLQIKITQLIKLVHK